MNEFIDTHCHLNDEKFADDLIGTIKRAKLAGVNRIINFGDTIESSKDVVKLASEHDDLFAGIGIHPEEIDDFFNNDSINILADLANHKKVVAIGEIGLDYHWEKDFDRRKRQQEIFIKQLDLARQLDLPVCIHERDAHGDALKILKSEAKGLRGVLHCFSGSLEMEGLHPDHFPLSFSDRHLTDREAFCNDRCRHIHQLYPTGFSIPSNEPSSHTGSDFFQIYCHPHYHKNLPDPLYQSHS